MSPGGRAPAHALADARPAGLPTPSPTRIDPRRMVAAFAHLFLEAEAGRTPRGPLRRLMTPWLYDRLEPVWLDRAATARHERREVVRVRGQWRGSAFEAAAVVRRGRRVGALAIRLERWGGGWRVTELACPDRGVLAPARDEEPRAEADDAHDPAVAEAERPPAEEPVAAATAPAGRRTPLDPRRGRPARTTTRSAPAATVRAHRRSDRRAPRAAGRARPVEPARAGSGEAPPTPADPADGTRRERLVTPDEPD